MEWDADGCKQRLATSPTLPNPANGISVEDRVVANNGKALNLALGGHQTVKGIPMMCVSSSRFISCTAQNPPTARRSPPPC